MRHVVQLDPKHVESRYARDLQSKACSRHLQPPKPVTPKRETTHNLNPRYRKTPNNAYILQKKTLCRRRRCRVSAAAVWGMELKLFIHCCPMPLIPRLRFRGCEFRQQSRKHAKSIMHNGHLMFLDYQAGQIVQSKVVFPNSITNAMNPMPLNQGTYIFHAIEPSLI